MLALLVCLLRGDVTAEERLAMSAWVRQTERGQQMMLGMADQHLTAKLSRDGRVVIPAQVLHRMNLRPGDVIRFAFNPDTGRAEILTARHLIAEMWANNRGGDVVDSAAAIRLLRREDQEEHAESEARIAADAGEPWNEATETARLLDALNLA